MVDSRLTGGHFLGHRVRREDTKHTERGEINDSKLRNLWVSLVVSVSKSILPTSKDSCAINHQTILPSNHQT